MSNLIKSAAELEIPSTVKMMIYGQAGMGKSTLALSSPKPLLVDFDNGVKRINESNLEGIDIVQVNQWQEIRTLFETSPNDIAPYESIIVDTVGKMMDYIISYVCGTRQPSIRDWGTINMQFQWFTRTLSVLNKNIVFIAQRDTRKDGDNIVYIPALREKNYSAIVTELDLLGYMEMKTLNGVDRRTITFNPTDRNDGKNTCFMPAVMNIPTILDQNGKEIAKNDFIESQVIAPYLKMLSKKKSDRTEYDKLIEEIKTGVEEITDADSANFFIEHINDYKHVGSSLARARSLFAAKVKSLNLKYDKEKKTYAA
jgi:phage nucleotide-binding protein